MVLPPTVPVMTLSNSILFPGSMLPLHIFEPRYKKMLADVLEGDRMFAIAMRKPGSQRETPSSIAGIGLVRAAVTRPDGSAHVVLQGLARVRLKNVQQYKPYRIQHVNALRTTGNDSLAVDALSAKVLDLVAERFQQGFEFPLHILDQVTDIGKIDLKKAQESSLKNVIKYLNKIEDPDRLADLVSCTLLPTPVQRQMILETVNLETRLKFLIHFLIAEISDGGNNKTK
ncbi:MAG: peptidase lon domain protein [Verrucomicrobiales bacterium]|jgi:ATP-dependent Lon protease|nr:peptidase lon domain protein [Verrucomicrobiales bacterium]